MPSISATPAGAPGPAPPVTPGLKLGVGIASVVVPLVGFIMGIVYMADANPQKKSVGKLWLMLACGGMLMYCMFGAMSRM